MPSGQGNHGGCACPGQVSPAPRAAGPPRVARGPTPRTEEAAWAAMALTFLLVLLTLATLCTRLHRNFRRSESIYWGPTADSQDTVAGEKSPPPPFWCAQWLEFLALDFSPSHSSPETEAAFAFAPDQAVSQTAPAPTHTG
jgi:hypothetical protein